MPLDLSDSTLAAIPGDPALAARHAAHILRHIPELLRDARTRRGQTPATAAREIGITQVELSRFEDGSRKPNYQRALRILDWIGGAPPAYLTGALAAEKPDGEAP